MATYWTAKDYTPFFLIDEPTHTPQEIRAEYSRIRSILMKRAKRMRDLGFDERAAYMENLVPKLTQLDSAEVPNRLSQAKALMSNRSFSIKGIRDIEKDISEKTGFDIPVQDILDFASYMESWRLSSYRYIVTTKEATALYYTEYTEIGGTFENFYNIYLLKKYVQKR